jgi:hypothetical protein
MNRFVIGALLLMCLLAVYNGCRPVTAPQPQRFESNPQPLPQPINRNSNPTLDKRIESHGGRFNENDYDPFTGH